MQHIVYHGHESCDLLENLVDSSLQTRSDTVTKYFSNMNSSILKGVLEFESTEVVIFFSILFLTIIVRGICSRMW
jgi:hypothetical protein